MDSPNEPAWIFEDCLSWDHCGADDCGVNNDGTGCQLHNPDYLTNRQSTSEVSEDGDCLVDD